MTPHIAVTYTSKTTLLNIREKRGSKLGLGKKKHNNMFNLQLYSNVDVITSLLL